MTQPAPQPAFQPQPAPEPTSRPTRAPASEPNRKSEPTSTPAHNTQRTEDRTRRQAQPPAPPIERESFLSPPEGSTVDANLLLIDERLAETSRKTRDASRRSWFGFGILLVVAVGSVVGGMIAESDAFWASRAAFFARRQLG
jgi:hypothetical protein